MFSSSKNSMSASSLLFLGGPDFCRDCYVYLRNVRALCVYLLYLEWTHKTCSDMEPLLPL